jgi:hypothetical protein
VTIDLGSFERDAADAVRQFWRAREDAAARQRAGGASDQGERAGVTAGKNMAGFSDLLANLARANGLADATIHTERGQLTLPGFFRPTKNWDLLVFHGSRLLAAVELKSQVGPSFGNNFNNRAEEAIGTAQDLVVARREGALGDAPRPFVGWLILVEDADKSRAPGVRLDTPHFDVCPEFKGASYLERYDLLCRRLMRENLYDCAAVVTTRRDDAAAGRFGHVSPGTSLRRFAETFAGYAAAEAIREP